MTIRVERERDAEAWDAYAAQFAAAGPFHARGWAEGFADARTTPLYLRLLDGEQPVGAIAGVAIEPRLAALRGISRELFFFSGPALARMDADLIRDAFLALSGYAREQGFTSLVSSARDYPYAYDWGEARAHLQTLGEYLVDLRGSWDEVRLRMRRSIAEQARKAGRAGVGFGQHRDASLLPQLLRLLANTRQRRQRKSGNLFSPYYLTHLDDDALQRLAASSLARFFVARRGDEALCVLLAFVFGRRAYALMIGSSDEGYQLRAPALLWFNTVRQLQSEGVHWLNLAGGGPQSAHVFSKISLGAQRFACTGSVSPYLKGPVRNLLFQTHRWMDQLLHPPPLAPDAVTDRARPSG
jgi:hypothetical protein